MRPSDVFAFELLEEFKRDLKKRDDESRKAETEAGKKKRRPKKGSYRNPAKHLRQITPQKLDRKLLATIREGADSVGKILQAMKDFAATDLRISFQRLLDQKKIEVGEKGELRYRAAA